MKGLIETRVITVSTLMVVAVISIYAEFSYGEDRLKPVACC
jgi:hypothetical protein